MRSVGPHGTTQQSTRSGHVLIALGLAVLVLVTHGASLWDDVKHDDHLHRYNLQRLGWSWHDLIESTTFDFPGRQMHFWWQDQPVQWRYPRPVTMAILKAEFFAVGGRPIGMHAFSLCWHLLCTWLVFRLAFWGLSSVRWALLAAVVFNLNPNGALTVSWTAGHNVLISTAFLLGAMCAYTAASFNRERKPASLRAWWLVLSIVLWALGLFSREGVIVFPALTLGLDLCYGGWRHASRRWPVYALLGVLALAFVYWRLFIFPVGEFPGGYLETPRGLGYGVWAVNKLIQLLTFVILSLPLFTPLDYVEAPIGLTIVVQVVLTIVALSVTVSYARRTRAAPGRWFWLLWLVVAFLPVVPVASMPHFAYLPYVGCAVAVAISLAHTKVRWRRPLVVLMLLFMLVVFQAHRALCLSAIRAEQLVRYDILSTTQPPPPGSKLFFINLPLSASFTTYALREAWGVDDIEGYTLTLATDARGMDRLCSVERLTDHDLIVSSAEPGYFASALERWFLRLTGPNVRFKPGLTMPGDLFDTTVLQTAETADQGVTELRFSFNDTLGRDDYFFYVSTIDRPAYRLRFDPAFDADALARETAQFQADHAELLMQRDAPQRLGKWLKRLIGRDQEPAQPDQPSIND